jgi:hypothetical protein
VRADSYSDAQNKTAELRKARMLELPLSAGCKAAEAWLTGVIDPRGMGRLGYMTQKEKRR